jgi:hypothetical protein
MKPLPVIYASRAAAEQAIRLGLARPLENEVADAIRCGRVRERKADGLATFHIDGGKLVAVAKRSTSALTNRKSWRVTAVQRRQAG